MRRPDLTIATANGAVGGGEVMLLAVAEAARSFGLEVRVVAPTEPSALATQARSRGFDVVALEAHDRWTWMRALRRWDRAERSGLLWCNGLVPALATAGLPDRVVHLHLAPHGAGQRASRMLATRCVRAVVVPSETLGAEVPHTVVLPNWTAEPPDRAGSPPATRVVGFLGRLTAEKGVHLLADAVRTLNESGDDVTLVLAGEDRFGTEQDRRTISAALAPIDSSVQRWGWVDRATFFSSVDVAVFPSTNNEAFGLVAAEAMAARVPFVVSDAGALPEVVGPDHPWVARHGDSTDLARVLADALDADAITRAAAVDAARVRWEQHYSPAAGTARLATLLHDLGLATTPGVPVR